MKKVLSTMLLAAALFVPAAVNAQSTQIATLAHDGEIRLFTGASALIDANAAADDGDVITLSPGTYVGTTITKRITLRGAGMFLEDNGTIINGNLTIKPDAVVDDQPITIEGLKLSSDLYVYPAKVNVTKCDIQRYYQSGTEAHKINFVNSFIMNYGGYYANTDDITFINSVINKPSTSDKATYVFENCYIIAPDGLRNSTIRNSLLKNAGSLGTSGYSSSAKIIDSVVLANYADVLYYCTSVNTKVITPIPDSAEIWKNEARYVLTDENAKNWLGGDGTQVSIYGGMMPFDPTPSNPQITKFNVASKTSADGKLSVDIEVKSAE